MTDWNHSIMCSQRILVKLVDKSTCRLLWTGPPQLQPLHEGNLIWQFDTSEYSYDMIRTKGASRSPFIVIVFWVDRLTSTRFWKLTTQMWAISQRLWIGRYLRTGLREVTDQTKTELASNPESPDAGFVMTVMMTMVKMTMMMMKMMMMTTMLIAWCNVGSIVTFGKAANHVAVPLQNLDSDGI